MSALENKNLLNDISERLFLAIESVGYSRYKLAKEVDGISQQTLTNINAGKSIPSTKVIHGFLKKFPFVNANWLLTGEGPMLNDKNIAEETENDPSGNKIDNPYSSEFLDGFPVDEIIAYIQRNEKRRGFDKSDLYKMFLEIRVQKAMLEKVEEMDAKYNEVLKILKDKKIE